MINKYLDDITIQDIVDTSKNNYGYDYDI